VTLRSRDGLGEPRRRRTKRRNRTRRSRAVMAVRLFVDTHIGEPLLRDLCARGVVVKIRSASLTSRVMVVAIMVSMVAFLDSTVVNLALPATGRDLGGGLSLQQWVVDGYLLALAAMILPGGSTLRYLPPCPLRA
jgi:hypothetical protein